jgi:hypothetical protein
MLFLVGSLVILLIAYGLSRAKKSNQRAIIINEARKRSEANAARRKKHASQDCSDFNT